MRLESKGNYVINQATLSKRAAGWSAAWVAYFCSVWAQPKSSHHPSYTHVVYSAPCNWLSKGIASYGKYRRLFNLTNRIENRIYFYFIFLPKASRIWSEPGAFEQKFTQKLFDMMKIHWSQCCQLKRFQFFNQYHDWRPALEAPNPDRPTFNFAAAPN